MTFLVLAVLVLLVGFAVAAVTGRLGPGMDEATSSQASMGLPEAPEGELDPGAVEEVRFDQGLRGYRMDQVDALLDRLAVELRVREARLAELEDRFGGSTVNEGLLQTTPPAESNQQPVADPSGQPAAQRQD